MAATPEGTNATEAHRRAQARQSASLVRDVLRLWPLLDPLRLDATALAWLRLVLDLIDRYRTNSTRTALEYVERFRLAEIGTRPPSLPTLPANQAWRKAAATSLLVTGPSTVKTLTGRGIDPATAAERAAPGVAAAAVRHAAAAGRDLVDEAARTDPAVQAYQRITSASPCAFCAMLASRGPKYLSERSGLLTLRDGEHEPFHDGCLCSVELVYRDDSALPEASARFAALWETATEGHSGKKARAEFRRAYDAQRSAR